MARLVIVCITLMQIAFLTIGAIPAHVDFPEIDAGALLQHIKVLSSDSFEGRAPGTEGETQTVAYIEARFKDLGLKPGNTDGTYVQKVPMVGIRPDSSMALTFRGKNKGAQLNYLEDFVAWTRRTVPVIVLKESPLLFVGYGIQAPEFNWDDYKGVDVRGKTLVMLVNDPPVPDPRDPAKLDSKIFGGDAMTYYGRWSYKYDIGGQKGAAGVLIVHETAAAGYPWSVVKGFGGERFGLQSEGGAAGKALVEGWIGLEQARQLFALAGQDFDALKKQAATRAFRPVPFDVDASLTIRNTMRTIASRNVLAKLEGSNPKLANEYVIYTAHWDHLGVGQPVNGDRIYHGALDNASGVAGLLEIARAFKKLPTPPS
jgi:hypothetical protein